MKKIFLILLSLLMLSSVVFANDAQDDQAKAAKKLEDKLMAATIDPSTLTKVALFVEIPTQYINNEKIGKVISEKMSELFPKTKFFVIPHETANAALRIYKEDNRMTEATPINREDIQKISKEIGSRYTLFLKASNNAPSASIGFMSATFKSTIVCDIRLLDVETKNYLVTKEIIKDGKSSSFFAGVPSFTNAYADALEQAFDEFKFDTSTLTK